jgi:hypothetical protein
MSEETVEVYRAMDDARRDRRQAWRRENLRVLDRAGLLTRCRSANEGESLLFREAGKPKVDFFPSSGLWRAHNQTFRGGGRAFAQWYKKQESAP